MFAEFEREAHAMVERGEALNAAALNALYKLSLIHISWDGGSRTIPQRGEDPG